MQLDVSNVHRVPDHQEVSRDESLIFELLDLKHEVEDGESAVWFLHDLATEQDAEESVSIFQPLSFYSLPTLGGDVEKKRTPMPSLLAAFGIIGYFLAASYYEGVLGWFAPHAVCAATAAKEELGIFCSGSESSDEGHSIGPFQFRIMPSCHHFFHIWQ
ncbi:hypothetical protein ACLOJK_000190 [Asimina triloba]